MLQTLRSIFSLLLSFGLLLLANGLLSTLLALRAQLEGFSTTYVGLITAVYYLGVYIGAMYGDRLVNLAGHIRAFAVYATITSITALIHAVAVDEYVWLITRLITGVSIAGLIIVTEAWLNSKAVNKNRGQIMAMYMITNYFAGGAGQLFIPFADPSTYILFSVASIFFSLSLIPVLLTKFAAPEVYARNPVRMRDLYKFSPVGMCCSFSSGMAAAALWGLGPVYIVGIGMSVDTAAYFMAAVIFGAALFQWHVGKLSDGLDRRKVIIWICIGSAILAFLIVLASNLSIILFIVIAILYGALSCTLYSVAMAHTNDLTSPDEFMKAASGILTAYGTGAILGPIFAAAFMEWFDLGALFIYLSIIFSLNVVFVSWRMTKRTELPDVEAE